MVEIEKSYLSLIWRFIWGLILLEIPFFMLWAQIGARHYTYDRENLTVKTGVFTTNRTTIPLYKIENVSSEANILGNGSISISSQIGGAKHIYLDYVANSAAQADALSKVIAASKAAHGVQAIDAF